MKCPKCNATLLPYAALFKPKAEFKCNACKSRLRLVRYWWVILLPSALVMFFPFDLIKGTATMLIALSAAVVAISYAALQLLVRVELISDAPVDADC
ncbi:MAG: hypothetical protein V4542_11785 [Pseudomonadota bacterium]